MSLRIRLARGGAKKRPFYRIVVADARSPRDGRFVEKLGIYNPVLPADHSERLRVKEDRVAYWLGVGAQATDRVAKLLGVVGVTAAPAVPVQTKKNQPKAKAQERLREAAERAKAAAEAAEAEAAAAAAPAEGGEA
ncbi:30S ribosomal protein S16 [Novispirillum sp. DQ9]|uniref:30S ribosomal protein S16 n=1 Tax=Novispirillum sp. DQ9 TaxID=3398612 RepID=UPI003C79DCD4